MMCCGRLRKLSHVRHAAHIDKLFSKLFSRAVTTLSTTPGATLRVTGKAARLVVRTNMETYVAELEAKDETGTELDAASWVRAEDGGDLHVVAAGTSSAGLVISVPASFNVHVAFEGTSSVDVQGWLEGTVHIEVGQGDVSVNTVRGLLTSISTGRGDVKVEHVEGNLHVQNGDEGSVSLGKIMGEDLRVLTSGALKARALYAKRLDVEAAAGMNVGVLSANEGLLSLRGDSTLSSTEGVLKLTHSGRGSITVQAGETLRSLSVSRANYGAPGGGTACSDVAPSAALVTLYLPSGMAARAEVRAKELVLDEKLQAERVERPAMGAAETRGAVMGMPSVEGFINPPPPLSKSGTKTFAGYDSGSSTSLTPWWTAEARNAWSSSADAAARRGCESYLLGGATVEATKACELSILADDAHVTIGVKSWFEQRLKLKAEHKQQPYR